MYVENIWEIFKEIMWWIIYIEKSRKYVDSLYEFLKIILCLSF